MSLSALPPRPRPSTPSVCGAVAAAAGAPMLHAWLPEPAVNDSGTVLYAVSEASRKC